MIEEPRMLTVQRTEQAKQRRRVHGDLGVKFAESKEYTLRQDDMSNTITTVEKDNLLVEPTACAIRTHNYREEPTRLIMGGEVANALTSVQKDSMIIQKVGDRGTDNYSVHDYANTIPANPMSDRGQLLVEPVRIRTATALGYDECPVGGGLDAAYPNSKLRRGRVQDNGNVIGALTSQGDMHCVYEGKAMNQNTNKSTYMAMEQQPQYRIRKLTPVETGRLMGMDDADIHKMLDPKDDKGKPIISKSQAYKLHGNSIVVDVLYHIFRKAFIDIKPTEPQQLTLF